MTKGQHPEKKNEDSAEELEAAVYPVSAWGWL